jgi:hypothetical protein
MDEESLFFSNSDQSQNWFCEHLQETQEPPVFDEKNIEKPTVSAAGPEKIPTKLARPGQICPRASRALPSQVSIPDAFRIPVLVRLCKAHCDFFGYPLVI